MKSRPILFSGPMVRGLLAGIKTQTRRIMKVQPSSVEYHLHGDVSDSQNGMPTMRDETGQGWSMCGPFKCPYITDGVFAGERGELLSARMGDVSDNKSLLWVRETWRSGLSLDKWSPKQIATSAFDAGYRKPWAPIRFEADESVNEYGHTLRNFGDKWGKTRVSIHMPRWASRITLEITNVRVERLQEISDADAFAEGIQRSVDDGIASEGTARDSYRALWESIHGPGSWDANQYVWVIEFKRADK